MNLHQTHTESVTEVVKATPLGTVAGFTFFGYSVPEIIQLLTLGYAVLIIIDKAWVMYRRWKEKDEPKE